MENIDPADFALCQIIKQRMLIVKKNFKDNIFFCSLSPLYRTTMSNFVNLILNNLNT